MFPKYKLVKGNIISDNSIGDKYNFISIMFHWTIAFLSLSIIILGFMLYYEKFPSSRYDSLHYWHRSFGELLFTIIICNFYWRSKHHPPPPQVAIAWERWVATFTKISIYVLLIILPVSKIVRDSFGLGWVFFGISVPALFPPNVPLGLALSKIHYYAAISLSGLIILHISAAAWHKIIRRDTVLSRILPW